MFCRRSSRRTHSVPLIQLVTVQSIKAISINFLHSSSRQMATSSDKSDIEIDFMVSKYPDLSHLLAAGSKSVLMCIKMHFRKKSSISKSNLERILNQLQSHLVSQIRILSEFMNYRRSFHQNESMCDRLINDGTFLACSTFSAKCKFIAQVDDRQIRDFEVRLRGCNFFMSAIWRPYLAFTANPFQEI